MKKLLHVILSAFFCTMVFFAATSHAAVLDTATVNLTMEIVTAVDFSVASTDIDMGIWSSGNNPSLVSTTISSACTGTAAYQLGVSYTSLTGTGDPMALAVFSPTGGVGTIATLTTAWVTDTTIAGTCAGLGVPDVTGIGFDTAGNIAGDQGTGTYTGSVVVTMEQ